MWFFGRKTQTENNLDIIVQNQEEYQRDELAKVEYDDVAFFHLNGYKTLAKVLSNYDYGI